MKKIIMIIFLAIISFSAANRAVAQEAYCSFWSNFDFYEYDYEFENNTDHPIKFTVTESATIFAPEHTFTTDPIAPGLGIGMYPLIAYPSNVYGTDTVHITIKSNESPNTVLKSYDFVHRRIAENDAMLILDKSGSMSLQGKIQSVKTAAAAFLDAMAPSIQTSHGIRYNRYGVVLFNQQADFLSANYPDFPQPDGSPNSMPIGGWGLRSVDFVVPANIVNTPVTNALNGITPGGTTSIGGGLRKARETIVEKATDMRRIVLLLSDGKENTAPWIADEEQALVDSGTKVYSIGFGYDYLIDAEKLQDLSSRTGGLYRHIDDPDNLSKFFMEVLAEGFDMSVLLDPVENISSGQKKSHAFNVSSFDRELIFILTWKDPSKNLEFKIVTPTKEISAVNQGNGVTYISRNMAYKIFKVAFADCGKPPCPAPGLWRAEISAANGVNERYNLTVLTKSGVYISVPPVLHRLRAGEPMPLQARLIVDGKQVDDAKVIVNITAPAEDFLSNISKRTNMPGKLLSDKINGDIMDIQSRRGWTIYNGKAIKKKVVKLELKKTRDSKYAMSYSALFNQVQYPGNYELHFNILWKNKNGETVTRECNRTVLIYSGSKKEKH